MDIVLKCWTQDAVTYNGKFFKIPYPYETGVQGYPAYELARKSGANGEIGANNEVRIVERETGKILGAFGRNGRQAGEFHWVHNLAVDSNGNIFTTEVDTGKRAQKFLLQGNFVLRKRSAQ